MKKFAVQSVLMGLSLVFGNAVLAKCQLVHQVKGYTPTANSQELHTFDWLAFDEGKILATGSGAIPQAYNGCIKIDGKNKTLLPGLIDAHGHVSSLGIEMLRVNLRGVKSEAEAANQVKLFADKNPNARWITGRGWNQVLWLDKSFPTKTSLAKAGIKRPVLLGRIDGHAAWANNAALKLAGITRNTADPAGGKIIRDDNGEATGVLIDNAIGLVQSKIPTLSSLELEYAFDKAYQHLLSLGIVSTHDAGVGQQDLDSYIKRSKEGRLPLRIYGMLSGSSPNLMKWLEDGIISDPDDFLSIRSVKLYSDGALGSRGAALLAPYSDDVDNKGLLLTEPKALDKLVQHILKKGFQANVHAIGDRGNRVVLDAYQKAYKTVGGKELRNRIEHSQVVALEDIPRFKTLNIVASMQPTHATSDKNMAGDRLGNERLKGAYAWQKFIQQGTIIASGSDFPVELANPFHGLHAAITRQSQDNLPKGGWLPNERMSPAQALRSFTLDAAYSAHQEKTLGSLEKGKWADFILIDQDIATIDPKLIWQTKVYQTWIGGEKKYQLAK